MREPTGLVRPGPARPSSIEEIRSEASLHPDRERQARHAEVALEERGERVAFLHPARHELRAAVALGSDIAAKYGAQVIRNARQVILLSYLIHNMYKITLYFVQKRI